MASLKLTVKWQNEKKTYEVECDTTQPPELFKAQVFALTGVPPDRQKLMFKGVLIKDENWGGLEAQLRDKSVVMLLGNADILPQAPATKTKFVEDMDDGQLAQALKLPIGMRNLGNTCFANASLQFLSAVPPLRSSLERYNSSIDPSLLLTSEESLGQQSASIALSMKNVFAVLGKSNEALLNNVALPVFIQVLRREFPRFAERGENGGWKQQDANECFGELRRCLQSELRIKKTEGDTRAGAYSSEVDRNMAVELGVTYKCDEPGVDEPERTINETQLQLSCFIDKDVKYLHSGIKQGLEEKITKRCETLGRDAVYTRKARVTRLPGWLCVQFVRFYYKERENVNAKILKEVQYPLEFDAYDVCSEDLKSKLTPKRTAFREEEERRLAARAAAGNIKSSGGDTDANRVVQPTEFADDPGSNDSGYYELQAVLTHQGRSSNSGHYVSWIRQKNDVWFKMDDDEVSMVRNEDVLKLAGGGDWHCAYLLLYGPRALSLSPEASQASTASTAATTGKPQ